MTEQDWLNSTDPVAMLDWRQDMDQVNSPPRGRGWGMVSDRKLRLFACASWRAYSLSPKWQGTPQYREKCCVKIELVEQWADGVADREKVEDLLADEVYRGWFPPGERGV